MTARLYIPEDHPEPEPVAPRMSPSKPPPEKRSVRAGVAGPLTGRVRARRYSTRAFADTRWR